MEHLQFSKWEGTGNDFILIDDRERKFPVNDLAAVRALCDRHFGIGSDGLVLLQPGEGVDYHMEFFNPDGSRSFCGNGSRCSYAFWCQLTGSDRPASFSAIDGRHDAEWRSGLVSVTLGDVGKVSIGADVDRLHNGSPHELVWVEDPDAVPIMQEGPKRAHDVARGPGGTNVNFVRVVDARVEMRTFERGVEAETLSCGTGVAAAGIAAIARGLAGSPVEVRTKGGILQVEAQGTGSGGWTAIRLTGPVREVFRGSIGIKA